MWSFRKVSDVWLITIINLNSRFWEAFSIETILSLPSLVTSQKSHFYFSFCKKWNNGLIVQSLKTFLNKEKSLYLLYKKKIHFVHLPEEGTSMQLSKSRWRTHPSWPFQ